MSGYRTYLQDFCDPASSTLCQQFACHSSQDVDSNMALTLILRSTLALGVSWYLWAYISSPLKSFPNGHWSSGVSNVWRFLDVWSMKAQWTHIRLHERYGSAVRMGPNIVNISDPYALKDIFRSRDPWKKVSNVFPRRS